MRCPSCHSENRDGVRFCEACGARVHIGCPSCGNLLPSGKRFCGKCGRDLSAFLPKLPEREAIIERKIASTQGDLPGGLTETVLSLRNTIEGERRQVTVMFCDMEGFTPLTERLGPEETYAIVDAVYDVLIHRVHEFGGTVNEMTGDGIMALFGAPIAVEDAAQRAILSSLAIHAGMAELSEKMRGERETVPIKMRVGIHTGPVVVGTLGNDLRVGFKAVGDTVNLASRMEGLAEPGTSCVTEETFRLTEGLFMFESLGERQVKGKERPVRAYRVIAPTGRRTRFDVSAERGLTPLVGRERELGLLLDGYARVKGGRGEACLVVAEAGAGKSRLLYEFRKRVADEEATFLVGRCLSYGSAVAYHPITEVLRSLFDVREGERDLEITGKVRAGLKALGLDEESNLPYLLEILWVKESGIERLPMSREARRDRITQAVNRLLVGNSRRRPLVLVVEDLHWIDRSSGEYLDQLLDRIGEVGLFLILSCRPEVSRQWIEGASCRVVGLGRLSREEGRSMIAHLLGTDRMEQDLEALILEKTEGVPFFIEEFVRSLKELGIIEVGEGVYRLAREAEAAAIPATLNDVIMARVDVLPPEAKEMLQWASVIEREFSYELIEQVAGTAREQVTRDLNVLKESNLLLEKGRHPGLMYAFGHALTQEVVYNSILSAKRRRLHQRVGRAVEGLHREDIGERYVTLARHFIASEDWKKGALYSKLAARKAEKSSSFTDAIVHARRTVACLERLPRTDEVGRDLIDARTALGLYLFHMSYVEEAKEAIDPVVAHAQETGTKKRLSQIYTILGSYDFMLKEDCSSALEKLEKAVQYSDEAQDILSSILANHLLGLALSWNCEFERAALPIQRAIDITVAARNLWGTAVIKSHASLYSYNYQGKVDLGYRTSREAMEIAEQTEDILARCIAHTCHGISCFYKGFFNEAVGLINKGVELCERAKLLSFGAVGHQWLGYACTHLRDYEGAQHHFSRAVDLRERSGLFLSTVNLSRMAAAVARAMEGAEELDVEALHGYVRGNGLELNEGSMARSLAEVLLYLGGGREAEARHWIEAAVESHRRYGMMWDLARDHLLYGEWFRRRGDLVDARTHFGTAREIFLGCGAEGWAETAEGLLLSLIRNGGKEGP